MSTNESEITPEDLRKYITMYDTSDSLIKNREALQPDFIPDTILYRKKEIEDIIASTMHILGNNPVPNVYITGLPGTGKTAIIKHIIYKIFPLISSKKNFSDPKESIIYTECKDMTEYSLLLTIFNKLDIEKPKRLCNTKMLYNILQEELKNRERHILTILDEFDKTRGDTNIKALSQYTRMHYFNFLIIANDESCVDNLSPFIESSLDRDHIKFKNYGIEEMRAIVEQRIQLALTRNPFDNEAIDYISQLSSALGGDARYAIKLFRACVYRIIKKHLKKITKEEAYHAREAVDKRAQEEIVMDLSLGHAETLYYYLNNNSGSKTTINLYEGYKTKAGKECIIGYRQYIRYLHELAQIGILRQIRGQSDKGRGRSDRWYLNQNIDSENLGDIVKRKIELENSNLEKKRGG